MHIGKSEVRRRRNAALPSPPPAHSLTNTIYIEICISNVTFSVNKE